MIEEAIRGGDYLSLQRALEKENLPQDQLYERLTKSQDGEPCLFQEALKRWNWPIIELLSEKAGIATRLRSNMDKIDMDNMLTSEEIPKAMLKMYVDEYLIQEEKKESQVFALNKEMTRMTRAIGEHKKQVLDLFRTCETFKT